MTLLNGAWLLFFISSLSFLHVSTLCTAGRYPLQQGNLNHFKSRTEKFRFHNLRSTSLSRQQACSDDSAEAAATQSEPNMTIAAASLAAPLQPISILPRGDHLDKQIIALFLPAILNFAIVPLVGAADTFWVGRMHDALALAGQGAANQLFNSAFWFFSFLPSVITPLIAKAQSSGDVEGVKDRIGEATFIASMLGLAGGLFLIGWPQKALQIVLHAQAPAWTYATPYLRVRALTLLPALLATVAFAAFRGSMDVITPLKISLCSNLVNVLLDPIFIFPLGMGVTGAAVATCLAELTGFILYFRALSSKALLRVNKLWRIPSKDSLAPLLLGSVGMQIRALALNTGILAVTRATQALDPSGTAAAAHTISLQMFQLASVASLALSTVSSIIIPTERAKRYDELTGQPLTENNHRSGVKKGQYSKSFHALFAARQSANRLLMWSTLTGMGLGCLQLLLLPLLSFFSPIPAVQKAARLPTIMGAFLVFLNCIIWTGEGIQQGNESFVSLAITSVVATCAMLLSLRFTKSSLLGVWSSFGVLALVRLIGVFHHHCISGPLAPAQIKKAKEEHLTKVAQISAPSY